MDKSNKLLLECLPYSKQHLVLMEMTDFTPAQTLDVGTISRWKLFYDKNCWSKFKVRWYNGSSLNYRSQFKVMNLSPASAPSTSEVSVINVHCRSAKVSVEPK